MPLFLSTNDTAISSFEVSLSLSTLNTMFLYLFGTLLLLTTCIGLIGLFLSSHGLLLGYTYVLAIILLLASGGLFGTYISNPHALSSLEESAGHQMMLAIKQYKTSASIASLLQSTQSQFQCCGWTGLGDYRESLGSGTVPNSCCNQTVFFDSPFTTCEPENVPYPGCAHSVAVHGYESNLISLKLTVISLLILVAFIIVGVLFWASDLKPDPIPRLSGSVGFA